MFWALFDKTDLEEFETKDGTFEITQETAKVLFGLYSICAIVVALNMLIAMMGHSYDDISVRKLILIKLDKVLNCSSQRSTKAYPLDVLGYN